MIDQRTLKSTLTNLNRASHKSTPQLRLQRHEDTLRLTAYGNVHASLDLPLSGHGWNGEPAHVPTKALLDAVKVLPKGEVTVDHEEDGSITLTGGAMNVRVKPIDERYQVDEPRPILEPTSTVGIESGVLAGLLSDVMHAAADADYQSSFRHVRLHAPHGFLRAVATDGFRLAYRESNVATDLDVLIPKVALPTILKMLPQDQDLVIVKNDVAVSISWDGGVIRSALPETTWPDYERVIPSDFIATLAIDAGLLRDTLSRVLPLVDKSANARADIDLSESGRLVITAENDIGSTQQSITMDESTRLERMIEPVMAAYNLTFLMDALKELSGTIRVRWSGNISPTLIDAGERQRLIVPLRTS